MYLQQSYPASKPNNSFKPNLLRYSKSVAEKACHAFASITQVGLTQALGAHKQMSISFGDNVRILGGTATDAAGISCLSGCIYGETVPSASGVSVLGELSGDYAVNVFVEELNKDF